MTYPELVEAVMDSRARGERVFITRENVYVHIFYNEAEYEPDAHPLAPPNPALPMYWPR